MQKRNITQLSTRELLRRRRLLTWPWSLCKLNKLWFFNNGTEIIAAGPSRHQAARAMHFERLSLDSNFREITEYNRSLQKRSA